MKIRVMQQGQPWAVPTQAVGAPGGPIATLKLTQGLTGRPGTTGNAQISTDPGNQLTQGSDQKLFVPEGGGAGGAGAPGTPGTPGAKGDAGDAGPPGADGSAGAPGTPGAAGAPGTPGAKGDKGDANAPLLASTTFAPGSNSHASFTVPSAGTTPANFALCQLVPNAEYDADDLEPYTATATCGAGEITFTVSTTGAIVGLFSIAYLIG